MEENKKQNQEVVQSEIVPAGKMEFRLINPTEKGFIQTIKWNKEELEAAVRGKIAPYQNVVYTEDNIKQAKADRAELNKLKKAIDERRKKVKELVTQPYDTFKGEVDSVLELIDEPITLIDKQIKEFENQQKEQKKEELKKTYEDAEKILEERTSSPQSAIGKVIESVERQAYNTAVDPFRTQPTAGEKKYKTRFWAVGTMDELTGLTDYMKAHNIKFGKVE